MTKTTTIINSNSLNNNEINEPEKDFKTFSVHEANLSIVNHITQTLLTYKHLENILNILLQQQLSLSEQDNLTIEQKELNKDIFWLLLNPMVMKAVLSHNSGGISTKDSISKINNYFKDNHLFQQAKSLYHNLNDKNISMLIRRLNKDWKNYFSSLKEFYNGNPKGLTGKPSFPKPKKLSKVFNYSLPLEPSKFSLKKLKQGLLGINLGKKIFYTYIGKNIDYIQDKTINNITISYSHGHIYYQFTYVHNKLTIDNNNELNISKKKIIKEAGADVGINNLLSLFINDNTTQSLIISGKELISYNVHFNKRLAKNNELISDEVSSYKTVIGKNNKEYEVPESYTELGKKLIHRRKQLFERRKLYLDDYLNKMSKKVLTLFKIT